MDDLKSQLIKILQEPKSLDSLENLNLLDNQSPNNPLIKACIIACKRINSIDFEKDIKYFAFLLSYQEISGKYFEDDSWVDKLSQSNTESLAIDLIDYLNLGLELKTDFLIDIKD